MRGSGGAFLRELLGMEPIGIPEMKFWKINEKKLFCVYTPETTCFGYLKSLLYWLTYVSLFFFKGLIIEFF